MAADEVFVHDGSLHYVDDPRAKKSSARLALVVRPDDVEVAVAELVEAHVAGVHGLNVIVKLFGKESSH